MPGPAKKLKKGEKQVVRVRKVCTSLPGTSEKLSHGMPTFFVNKKVYVMFANNHHDDGHVAVWIPTREGMQQLLIEEAPEIYFLPPYVGVKGWVGVELDRVTDEALSAHIRDAWKLIAPKKLSSALLPEK